MKARWDSLIKRTRNVFDINIDHMFASSIYERYIVPHYTEDRYYHTLRHIQATLTALTDFELSPIDRVKVELGLWFHDIVYDSTKTDNEEQSAEHFAKFADYARIPMKDMVEISNLIITTKHVQVPTEILPSIICDCDLAELASPYYIVNAINVRKEYGFLTDKEWIKGRTEFIEGMLDKEHIYHTGEYRTMLEDTARQNLQKELDTLTKHRDH